MAEDVDRWLGNLDGAAASDRRNGACRRNLLSELGDIELKVSRTRRYCPVSVIGSYARRAPEIDRAILTGFVPGLSTRKVGETLLSLLGRPVAPTTVSRVAKTLDAAVQARRPLTDSYKGPDARRRGAQPQDRRRRPQAPCAGSPRPASRRQEGDRRLPPGEGRERRRMGALPRRSADLFPLQGPRSTQAGQNHQRYRATGGPAKNTPHGRFPGPHLDGPHPVRYLHPRKQTAGNQYPLPADT